MNKAWSIVAAVFLISITGCGLEIICVVPDTLSSFGYKWIRVEGEGFQVLDTDDLRVEVGGIRCVFPEVVDDTALICRAQGHPEPGPKDLVIYSGAREVIRHERALYYLPIFDQAFSKIINLGASLSACVFSNGFNPDEQTECLPALIAREAGAYFPTPLVLDGGIPLTPTADMIFVGDGVRPCYIPALDDYVSIGPGEICNPADFLGTLSIPDYVNIALPLLDEIIGGYLSGEGLLSGMRADPTIDVYNYAVPGVQLFGFTYEVGPGFNILQDMLIDPDRLDRRILPYLVPNDPVNKLIAEMEDPPTIITAFDYTYDSALFIPPEAETFRNELFFGLLTLITSEFYTDPGAPAWAVGVPFINTEDLTTTYQYIRFDIENFGRPKENLVPDYALLGFPTYAGDANGNGYIDIEEIDVAQVLADDAATKPEDNPLLIVLSDICNLTIAPSWQGDESLPAILAFNEVTDEIVALFDEAFLDQRVVAAGFDNNLVLVETFELSERLREEEESDCANLCECDYPFTYPCDDFTEYVQNRCPILDIDQDPMCTQDVYVGEFGGIFSWDHLHPGPGFLHAHIANMFIEAINSRLGTALPFIDQQALYERDPYALRQYGADILEHFGYHVPTK